MKRLSRAVWENVTLIREKDKNKIGLIICITESFKNCTCASKFMKTAQVSFPVVPRWDIETRCGLTDPTKQDYLVAVWMTETEVITNIGKGRLHEACLLKQRCGAVTSEFNHGTITRQIMQTTRQFVYCNLCLRDSAAGKKKKASDALFSLILIASAEEGTFISACVQSHFSSWV